MRLIYRLITYIFRNFIKKNTMKKSSLAKSIAIFSLLAILFVSCHKEGMGGKASLGGYVRHHSMIIPNCVVYIKYGATDFPGTDPSRYDGSVTADADGHYEFTSLYKGDYYLYAVGYDNSILEQVSGGISYKIKRNKFYSLDVPVTE